jgi:hypothetical protein
MYDVRPNIIIGFHGCDLDIRNKLVNNPDHIEISTKPYDWLGHGMYFWENNYTRAMEWAEERVKSGKFKQAAVLGAVLQLGRCCDFLDSKFTDMVSRFYDATKEEYSRMGKTMPANLDAKEDGHQEKLLRLLDCTVIENMHKLIKASYQRDMVEQGYSEAPIFDSTRGAFYEGGPAFTGAGISKKSHIQVCIRNRNCIKGFFIPRTEIEFTG